VDIISALRDPDIFGKVFPDLRTWGSWIVLLKAIFNLPMDPSEYELYQQCTRRKTIPQKLKEVYIVCGRRSGKSRIGSLLASYFAAFKNCREQLAVGEKAVILTTAADKKQAGTIFGYSSGIFSAVPLLSSLVENETAETIDLGNVSIEVHSASFRSLRGYSILLFIGDETSFWRNEESMNPDREIFDSVRGGMGTLKDSLLVALSSPYSRRGVMWSAYSKYFGKEDDRTLVWVADSKTMNPSLNDDMIAAAYKRDPVVAASEYGAEFRKDVEDFLSYEAVAACVVPGRIELPPISEITYFGFCDPSGGSNDSMTISVSHKEQDRVIIDASREKRPPFSPESTVEEFADLLKAYRIYKVTGDRYGGEFCREPFRRHGIDYKVSEKTKSEIYVNFLALVNSGRVELPDDKRLIGQLLGLERRAGRTKDSVDHGPGLSDDLANSVCGAAGLADEGMVVPGLFFVHHGDPEENPVVDVVARAHEKIRSFLMADDLD
jgi:hypothetical protein